ncbi:hypothetical protein AGMMS49543_18360 [Betaproteobacteria bacterium]|nr:hypothetical protein AGMMS49543_18360 [Betaproteobacteria bacterium]GHU06453.1 hypothetical protein AGMMS50225_01380 [Betaproteobacteria bacterium]GHU21718.1 hypothetical protein AGMMS50243_19940 [Betaproteobacteria bacterium]
MAALIAQRIGSQQHQRRTQAFAAALDDVLRHLPDQHDIGMETITENGIDRLHVGGNRREKLEDGQDKYS